MWKYYIYLYPSVYPQKSIGDSSSTIKRKKESNRLAQGTLDISSCAGAKSSARPPTECRVLSHRQDN